MKEKSTFNRRTAHLLLKYLSLLFLFIAFSACQKEEIVKSIDRRSTLIVQEKNRMIKMVDKEEILSNTALLDLLQKRTRNQNHGKSLVQKDDVSITFNMERAKYIEFGDHHSYTFVVTNTPEGQGLENLVLFSEKDGGYRMVLVRYDFTEKEMDYPKSIQITGQDFEMIELSEKQHAEQMSAKKDACVMIIVTWCSEEEGAFCENSETVVVGTNCGGGGGAGNVPPPNDEPQNPPTTGEPGSSDPHSGGGSNQNNGSDTGIVLSPTLPSVAMDTFISELSSAQQAWLENHDFFRLNIEGYLEAHDFSPESEAFADEAIEAEMSGGEADIMEEVIRDSTFVNNPCLNSVYEDLDVSDIASDFLSNFEGEEPVAHLALTVGVDPSLPNANAITYLPDNFVIEIMFNPNNLNRPRTSVARTFMHEIIHAELYRKLLSMAQQEEIPWTVPFINSLKNDFPGLYDYYTRWWLETNGQSPTGAQHEMMAQHYRNTISNFLMQFEPSLTQVQADALAWVGLRGGGYNAVVDPSTGLLVDALTGENLSTVAWTNLTINERLNIINIRKNFITNNPDC